MSEADIIRTILSEHEQLLLRRVGQGKSLHALAQLYRGVYEGENGVRDAVERIRAKVQKAIDEGVPARPQALEAERPNADASDPSPRPGARGTSTAKRKYASPASKRLIVEQLKAVGPSSRAQLTAGLPMSKGTLQRGIIDLLEAGAIIELPAQSFGGAPAAIFAVEGHTTPTVQNKVFPLVDVPNGHEPTKAARVRAMTSRIRREADALDALLTD